MGRYPAALLRLILAEPPHGGRGTHPPWGESRHRDGEPNAEPDSSPRRPNGPFRGTSVFRPSFHPSAHQRAIGRNLALDLVVAIGIGVTVALITTLLPTIARRGGLEPIGLAALAAAPFVANLLARSPAGSGPRSPRQLALVRGAGAASLLVLVRRRLGAGPHRRLVRVLAQPVVRRPVPAPAVGLDVPGAGARPGRRRARDRAGPRPRRWRRSSAGSSPTSSVA